MKNKFIYIWTVFLGLTACNNSNKLNEVSSNVKKENNISNVIKVQQFGDTLKIVTERQGSTIIKHYIDLKGTKGDNFDNSYTATLNYKEVVNDTTICSNFFLVVNDYKIYFDPKKIVPYCDSIIKTLRSDYDRENTKPYYENLRKRALNKKTNLRYFTEEPELIEKFNFKIINQKTKEKPKSILIEYYKTEFSGGKNFFVLTLKGDTVGLFNHMDYIK